MNEISLPLAEKVAIAQGGGIVWLSSTPVRVDIIEITSMTPASINAKDGDNVVMTCQADGGNYELYSITQYFDNHASYWGYFKSNNFEITSYNRLGNRVYWRPARWEKVDGIGESGNYTWYSADLKQYSLKDVTVESVLSTSSPYEYIASIADSNHEFQWEVSDGIITVKSELILVSVSAKQIDDPIASEFYYAYLSSDKTIPDVKAAASSAIALGYTPRYKEAKKSDSFGVMEELYYSSDNESKSSTGFLSESCVVYSESDHTVDNCLHSSWSALARSRYERDTAVIFVVSKQTALKTVFLDSNKVSNSAYSFSLKTSSTRLESLKTIENISVSPSNDTVAVRLERIDEASNSVSYGSEISTKYLYSDNNLESVFSIGIPTSCYTAILESNKVVESIYVAPYSESKTVFYNSLLSSKSIMSGSNRTLSPYLKTSISIKGMSQSNSNSIATYYYQSDLVPGSIIGDSPFSEFVTVLTQGNMYAEEDIDDSNPRQTIFKYLESDKSVSDFLYGNSVVSLRGYLESIKEINKKPYCSPSDIVVSAPSYGKSKSESYASLGIPSKTRSTEGAIQIFEIVSITGPKVIGISEGFSLDVLALSGYGELKYQWKINGIDIDGEVGATLAVSEAFEVDNGEYSVFVTDGISSELVGPVKVEVVDHFSYKWNIRDSVTRTVTVDNITQDDYGDIGVVVSDEWNSKDSRTANLIERMTVGVLSVSVAKSEFDDYPVKVGTTVTISTSAKNNVDDEAVLYEWYLTSLSGESSILVNTSSSIAVPYFSNLSAGVYKCKISCNGESAWTDEVRITELLEISKGISNIEINPWESWSFAVESIGGVGEVRYTWKLNGEEIGVGSSYNIPEVTFDDFGVYSVEAKDIIGHSAVSIAKVTSSSSNLFWEEEPEQISQLPASGGSFNLKSKAVSTLYTPLVFGSKGTLFTSDMFDSEVAINTDGSVTGSSNFIHKKSNLIDSCISLVGSIVLGSELSILSDNGDYSKVSVDSEGELFIANCINGSIISTNIGNGAVSGDMIKVTWEMGSRSASGDITGNVRVVSGAIVSSAEFVQRHGDFCLSFKDSTISSYNISVSEEVSYQWFKNSIAIPGETSRIFSISDAVINDSGLYKVRASDSEKSIFSESINVVVSTPLRIVTQPIGGRSIASSPKAIVVVVDGEEWLGYRYDWYVNGVIDSSAPNENRYLISQSVGDIDKVQCFISSIGSGKIVKTDIVSVKAYEEMVVTKQLESFESDYTGRKYTLSVTVTGGAVEAGESYEYVWKRNGNIIIPATSDTFVIDPSEIKDDGSYSVEIFDYDRTSSKTSSCLIPIYERVTSSITSSGGDFYVGDKPVIESVSTGGIISSEEDYTYEWFFDGVKIPGEGSSIEAVASGKYGLIVRDTKSSSSITNTVDYKFYEHVSITDKSADSTIKIGDDKELFVVASGGMLDSDLTYQWRLGGVAINSETRPSISIASARPSSAGKYTCSVSDGIETIESSAITLKVDPINLTITQDPSGGVFYTGNAISMRVSVAGGKPNAEEDIVIEYQWYRNNVKIPNATSQTFYAYNAVQQNSGDYMVSVSDGFTVVNSAVASVYVADHLVLSGIPESIISKPVNEQLKVTADVTGGVPGANGIFSYVYKWFKNGVETHSEDKETLTFDKTDLGSSGEYHLVVTDGHDVITSSKFMISIYDVIAITKNPEGGTFSFDSPFTLSVEHTGGTNDEIKYQWYLDDAIIFGADKRIYSVESASLLNGGKYFVKISDKYNTVVSSSALVVITISTHGAIQTNLNLSVGRYGLSQLVQTGSEMYFHGKNEIAVIDAVSNRLTGEVVISTISEVDENARFSLKLRNNINIISTFKEEGGSSYIDIEKTVNSKALDYLFESVKSITDRLPCVEIIEAELDGLNGVYYVERVEEMREFNRIHLYKNNDDFSYGGRLKSSNNDGKLHLFWPTHKFILGYYDDNLVHKSFVAASVDTTLEEGDNVSQYEPLTRSLAIYTASNFHGWSEYSIFDQYNKGHEMNCRVLSTYKIPGIEDSEYFPDNIVSIKFEAD